MESTGRRRFYTLLPYAGLLLGLTIERDLHFATGFPLSVWAETARRTGSIAAAEALLRVIARRDGGGS